ncbi:hypothetical protein [Parabacteroides distasonis]|uniref:hypothetical protein n=1 Tax=Parabacteroides distasonis TaxID=823 RepID=UPI003F1FA5EF
MSRTRVYSDDTIAVISRFFAAIDALVAMKKIRGKATYCRIANINRLNFDTQSKDYSRGYFQVSWVIPLIKDFNISSDWLLLGKGDMFKKD